MAVVGHGPNWIISNEVLKQQWKQLSFFLRDLLLVVLSPFLSSNSEIQEAS